MAADRAMVIRIAANIDQLKKNMADGVAAINTTTASLDRLSASFRGDKLIQSAHNVVAAIDKVGLSTLNAAEASRSLTLIEKAMQKIEAAGKPVPTMMQETAAALRTIVQPTTEAGSATTKFGGALDIAKGGLAALGASLSVGALVSWTKGLFDMAGQLSDLSLSTGVSVNDLQRLNYVGSSVGLGLDELGRAVGTLSDKLASGDESATAAVGKLGLNLNALIASGPKEAFVAIGEAVGRLTDPMEKNAVAADLFGGKLSKVLIPMLGDLRSSLEGVPEDSIVSDEMIAQADKMGDAWDHLIIKAKAYSFALLGTMGLGKKPFDPATASMKELQAEIDKMAGIGVKATSLINRLNDLRQEQALKTLFAAKAEQDLAREMANTVGPQQSAADRARVYADEQKKITDTAKNAADAVKAMRETLKGIEWQGVTTGAAVMQKNLASVTDTVDTTTIPALQRYLSALTTINALSRESVNPTTDFANALKGVGETAEVVTPELEDLITRTRFVGPEMAAAGKVTQSVWAGMGGALKSSLGSMTSTFASALEGGGGMVGAAKSAAIKTVSAVVGVIPVVGPILGGLVGPIAAGLGRLFNSAEKAVNRTRDAFIDAAGGLHELNVNAANAGVTLDRLLDAKTPEAYKKAIDDLNAAFAFQTQAMQTLDDTVKKWNIDLNLMGPAWDKQQLSKKAEELYTDWSVLHAAGIDQVEITQKMGDEVNAYIQKALAMGLEIPASMRPMLQNFADMGELIDENGNAITDLSDIPFAETMSQGFSRVVDAVDKLVNAILRGLNPAILNIPDGDYDVTEHRWTETEGERGGPGGGGSEGHTGGYVTPTGIQRFARGGYVWPRSGIDTVPAMLAPGEGVLNHAAMARIGGRSGLADLNTGGGNGDLLAAVVSMVGEVRQLRTQQAQADRRQQERLFLSLRDALAQQGKRR